MSLVCTISVQSSAKSSSRRSIKDTFSPSFSTLEIEDTAVASESDHITIVAVPEGILEHCREDDTKEQ